jgi:hypothetical protein
LIINLSKTGDFGRRVRWTMEKYGEPGCTIVFRGTKQ